MLTAFGLVEFVGVALGEGFFAEGEEMVEDFPQRHLVRLPFKQRQHDGAKGILQRGLLVESFQNFGDVGVALEFDDDSDAIAIAFVAQVGDAFDFFVVHQFRNLLD